MKLKDTIGQKVYKGKYFDIVPAKKGSRVFKTGFLILGKTVSRSGPALRQEGKNLCLCGSRAGTLLDSDD